MTQERMTMDSIQVTASNDPALEYKIRQLEKKIEQMQADQSAVKALQYVLITALENANYRG